MEIPPASAVEPIPMAADEPTAAAAMWEWGSLFDFTVVDEDPLILPWGTSDEAQTLPPLSTAELSSLPLPPAEPAPSAIEDGMGRVRKRDPRLVCPNYLAGRVPCSCPEEDEQAMQEVAVAGSRKRSRKGGASRVVRCQVPGCEADISELKGYHKRHRVCLRCANSSSVVLDGEHKRYCQQCGNTRTTRYWAVPSIGITVDLDCRRSISGGISPRGEKERGDIAERTWAYRSVPVYHTVSS
ncbi:hypothetical protein B296_00033107 [Ensete ventricosum]|uniref:SBP-type domain-containing protein n=1 Tax=Ensete ventricosum TaxID=4639 RepID=A0A427ABV0_ENSVE|nr:hypothetical protein B296_00033107 [Ensete ventricosum]